MELSLAGLEDVGSDEITTFERRKLLRQYSVLRDTLDPSLLAVCPILLGRLEMAWVLQSGQISYMKRNGVESVQLPSPSRDIPQFSTDVSLMWDVPLFEIDQVVMDPSQDLLVVIQPPSGTVE